MADPSSPNTHTQAHSIRAQHQASHGRLQRSEGGMPSANRRGDPEALLEALRGLLDLGGEAVAGHVTMTAKPGVGTFLECDAPLSLVGWAVQVEQRGGRVRIDGNGVGVLFPEPEAINPGRSSRWEHA